MSLKPALDLGCGRAKRPGAIGMDKHGRTMADVVADMDAPHLPFADGSFGSVYLTDSLEHAGDVWALMAEVERILEDGGEVFVRVPHFSSLHAFSDFTHRHFFSYESIAGLTGAREVYGHYQRSGFELKSARILMWRAWRVMGLEWLFNKVPGVYEKLFAFRFPAMALEFCLTKRGKSYI
ncbi:MAG: methyltransferase domain-containing protein [Nitrospinae bacterium]|nr:methyltransferase domain-containing protein [Nitrospinota bacterium]